MLRFILNQHEVETDMPPGTTVLDFVRYHRQMTGTKIGCREGDCGACTVLVGEYSNGEMVYKSVTSCLMPLGNAHHTHIVTIEGLNLNNALNAVQQAMSDEAATQCGFCTPGFVVSLAGFCVSKNEPTYTNAIAAINGNICRCTGYKSIERAADKVAALLQKRGTESPVAFATSNNVLPRYFTTIASRLGTMCSQPNGVFLHTAHDSKLLGGGTDLYVQHHDTMVNMPVHFLRHNKELKGITQQGNKCMIGGTVTLTEMIDSVIFQQYFPRIANFIKLVSSTPIRNMATIAGNFVNASPIGDLTIFFLALDAQVVLACGDKTRELPLRKLYKGYKQLDMQAGEMVQSFWFRLPAANAFFNFEKVSKRTHLDIASVNTALSLQVEHNRISVASLSAGGVGPVPLYLAATSGFLTEKVIDDTLIEEAIAIAQTEISPISDSRGSAAYKRLLLAQLIKAHFAEWRNRNG